MIKVTAQEPESRFSSLFDFIMSGLRDYVESLLSQRPGHKPVYTKGESTGTRILTIGLALIVFIVIDINLAVHDHWAWC